MSGKRLGKRDSKGGIVLVVQHGNQRRCPVVDHLDGETNLSIDCYELRFLRRYLLLVGQWYPKEWGRAKKNIFHIWQALLTLGVWMYFAYSVGFLNGKVLATRMKWFPVNTIENIVWESRWIMAHHIGLYYFCHRRHMETFLEESRLNETLWRDTSRYLKRICQAIILFVLFFPVSLHPAEMMYSVHPGDRWKIVLDTLALAVDRIVSVPIFLVFVFLAYVLVRVVKGFRARIEIWPKNYKNVDGSGMRAAKLQFREIKNLVSSVERAFQLYLSLHFLSLLLTAFLGVFACAEQLEVKVVRNQSYFVAGAPRYYASRLNIRPAATLSPIEIVQSNGSDSAGVLPFVNLNRRGTNLSVGYATNADSIRFEKPEKQVLLEPAIEAILRVLESIVLYLVPVTLMLRLQTKLRFVQQTILDLDCLDQKENGYLFEDEECIERMVRYVETCNGITIFGFKLPLFRTFLLSIFSPFLTAFTTFLFSYIHVKK